MDRDTDEKNQNIDDSDSTRLLEYSPAQSDPLESFHLTESDDEAFIALPEKPPEFDLLATQRPKRIFSWLVILTGAGYVTGTGAISLNLAGKLYQTLPIKDVAGGILVAIFLAGIAFFLAIGAIFIGFLLLGLFPETVELTLNRDSLQVRYRCGPRRKSHRAATSDIQQVVIRAAFRASRLHSLRKPLTRIFHPICE